MNDITANMKVREDTPRPSRTQLSVLSGDRAHMLVWGIMLNVQFELAEAKSSLKRWNKNDTIKGRRPAFCGSDSTAKESG